MKIIKNYKGHEVLITENTISTGKKDCQFTGEMVIKVHSTDEKTCVFFQMFNGFYINLGQILEEMIEDDEELEIFIKGRLAYCGNFLINI